MELLSPSHASLSDSPLQLAPASLCLVHRNLSPTYAAPRIEVKLQRRHSAVSRKVAALRKEKEEEELAALQPKPTISQRSRKLAVRAERRFFDEVMNATDLLEAPLDPATVLEELAPRVPSPAKPAPRRAVRPSPAAVENTPPPRTAVRLLVARSRGEQPRRPVRKAHRSLYHMSVLERSQHWQSRRSRKLEAQRQRQEADELTECTFTPARHAHELQVYEQYAGVRTTPKSRDSSFVVGGPFMSSRLSKAESMHSEWVERSADWPEPTAISPYQVTVGFRAGCNFEALRSRANSKV